MIDFHVISATGAIIKTFDDRDRAIDYARDIRDVFPGCSVDEVEVVTTRKTIYRSRLRPVLRVVAA